MDVRRLGFLALFSACLHPGVSRAASETLVIQEVDAVLISSAREWIELYNRSAAPISLAGWTIRDTTGAKAIPAFDLGPGCTIVLAASRTDFLNANPGFALPILELGYSILGNTLDDIGDSVFIADPSATDVDCMSYGASTACFSPSAPGAPSSNASLSRDAAGGDTDTAGDWSVVVPSPGAPCAAGVDLFPYSSAR